MTFFEQIRNEFREKATLTYKVKHSYCSRHLNNSAVPCVFEYNTKTNIKQTIIYHVNKNYVVDNYEMWCTRASSQRFRLLSGNKLHQTQRHLKKYMHDGHHIDEIRVNDTPIFQLGHKFITLNVIVKINEFTFRTNIQKIGICVYKFCLIFMLIVHKFYVSYMA